MLQQQAFHSHSRPLLTWRGLQAWSMGKRASGLCKFFIRIRRRPKLSLPCSPLTAHSKKNKREASTAADFFAEWLAKRQHQKRRPACFFAIATGCIKEEDRPNHDLKVDLGSKANKSVYKSHQKQQLGGVNHEFSTKLGSPDSSIRSCLQRQSSSLSNGESLSSSSSSSSGSSHHRLSGSKLKDTCSKVVHGGPAICELVTGNQFLMHLSAAPVVATPNHNINGGINTSITCKDKKAELNPSLGLVANSSLRHRDSDISDRIVFFK